MNVSAMNTTDSALIIAGATVIAYILGEGLTDAAGVQANAKPAYEAPTATVEDDGYGMTD